MKNKLFVILLLLVCTVGVNAQQFKFCSAGSYPEEDKGAWVDAGSSGTGPNGPEILEKRECISNGSLPPCWELRWTIPTTVELETPVPTFIEAVADIFFCNPWVESGGERVRTCNTPMGFCMETQMRNSEGVWALVSEPCTIN